jgi:glutamyl-tRNA synthetase
VNFLCLLGWNPKDNREQMSRAELVEAFKLEGVNRSNAVVNFTEEDPIDPKALWLNGQPSGPCPWTNSLAAAAYVQAAGWTVDEAKMRAVTPLVQERIRVLPEVTAVADLFFVEQLAPYDPAELVPQKGDAAMAERVLSKAAEALADAEFTHAGLESSLRQAASELGVKAGQMFCRSVWPFAAAKPLHRCSRPSKCLGGRLASNASGRRASTSKG